MKSQVTLWVFLLFAVHHMSFKGSTFISELGSSFFTIFDALVVTALVKDRLTHLRLTDESQRAFRGNIFGVFFGATMIAAAVTLGCWPLWAAVALSAFYGCGLVLFK